MIKAIANFITKKKYLPIRLAFLVWISLFIGVFFVFEQKQYIDLGFLPETGIIDVCRDVSRKEETNQLSEVEEGYVDFCKENVKTTSPAINYPAQKVVVIAMGVMLITLILYFLVKYEFAKSALNVFDRAFVGSDDIANSEHKTGFASWMLLLFFLVIGVLFIADNYI
ncbi:hypothetical protein KC909_02680 [Candidatus Dojkabacteria bacterium]|uniref:Uncharacterized protein n=1 Tax=Candidatus Dojkabacteria bacterium TaxID=2099670 RepID=A0A955RIZ4_9BACT|nr:hypothetical protein [Candidatus Dojkabacteria bacterium]